MSRDRGPTATSLASTAVSPTLDAARGATPRHAAGDTSFTESVDTRTGTVRARGCMTRGAVRQLGATLETLCHSGHPRLLLDLRTARLDDGVDPQAIGSLHEQVSAAGGRLTVLQPSESDVT